MGAQIIQQPNGLFAVFSTDTDTIVVIDATEDEVLAYFVALAVQDTTRLPCPRAGQVRSSGRGLSPVRPDLG